MYDSITCDKVASLADELGDLQAQIAQLQDTAKAVKQQLIDSGFDSADGDQWTATVVRSERKTVNWHKIAKDLGATAQKIAANTKTTPSIAVRVYGRAAKVA